MVKKLLLGALRVAASIPLVDAIALAALNIYRRVVGKPRMVHLDRRLDETPPSMPDRALYDALAVLNAVDAARLASADFQVRLGDRAQGTAVNDLLAQARAGLTSTTGALDRACREGSLLVRFQAAWNLVQIGESAAGLEAFRMLLSDKALFHRARRNALLREALVRSAEIVGEDLERVNDFAGALSLYQQVERSGGGGTIEQRLALVLLRLGRTREAGAWAERALQAGRHVIREPSRRDANLTQASRILTETSADPSHGGSAAGIGCSNNGSTQASPR